jgi:hypothetical protein
MAEPSFSNPHDRFFKELFARQENARDFCSAISPLSIPGSSFLVQPLQG